MSPSQSVMSKRCSTAHVTQRRGPILFTGPDGIGHYRPRLNDFHQSVGIGSLSPEATGDLNYLFRAAPSAPPLRPKHCHVGGVGWGVEYGFRLNLNTLHSDKQIKLTEFRSALEDWITHRYQNPRKAPPCFPDTHAAEACGRLAWNHNACENYRQVDDRQVLLMSKRRVAPQKTSEETNKPLTLPAIA